jgi:hypothetical protein
MYELNKFLSSVFWLDFGVTGLVRVDFVPCKLNILKIYLNYTGKKSFKNLV